MNRLLLRTKARVRDAAKPMTVAAVGALTIGRLAELAKADKQPALALTDTGNMFGALEFSEKMAGAGIQPIVGCALALDFGDQTEGPRGHPIGLAALLVLVGVGLGRRRRRA